MSKNNFASQVQKRWQDKVARERLERARLADELAYQLAQYQPRYIEIKCFTNEDVLPAEADSEGRIEYE